MPLRNFNKSFDISYRTLEDTDLVKHAKRKMGKKLYRMTERVFTEFIEELKIERSGGYFQLAHIIGLKGQASKKDVDYLWERMIDIYGSDEVSNGLIKKVFGTICMICICKDDRCWFYKEDMDKIEKKQNNEIPSANEYFMVEEYL